ncbi:MAG: hypothetical protein HQ559_02600, partial [Lentisphaerae bacterium]|nr:hypothetical protein [Lentisphaerota bacterium]
MMGGRGSGEKTVYVLGAGFSRAAGFPLQAEILQRVRGLYAVDLPEDVSGQALEDNASTRKFLDGQFGADQEPTLEDVFTLLDEIIADRAT